MKQKHRGKAILIRIDPDEDQALIKQARAEGTSKTKVMLRALRRELGLFVPDVPSSGNIRDEDAASIAA